MSITSTLVDIGVNLSSRQFANETDAILQRAVKANVDTCILIGTSLEEARAAIDLCESHQASFPDMLYATAGIHPHYADEYTPAVLQELRELLHHPAVKAVGETGLDFHRDFTPRDTQEKTFVAQLELAAECGLPLFMHEREAHSRQQDILRQYRDHLSDGVIHCFTGSRQALFRYLDMDLHIGITGWICDERRGQELRQLVASIPRDRLMLETDAPYLLPRNMDPKPTGRRNEPAYLPWVLEMVSRCRNESQDTVAQVTSRNARRFFRLPEKQPHHEE